MTIWSRLDTFRDAAQYNTLSTNHGQTETDSRVTKHSQARLLSSVRTWAHRLLILAIKDECSPSVYCVIALSYSSGYRGRLKLNSHSLEYHRLLGDIT